MKKQKEKGLSLKTQFKEAWSYIKESRGYIFIAVALFILSSIVGAVFQEAFAPMINEILKNLIDKTSGLNTPEMIFFILQNNAQSAFLSIFFGMIFGIFPIISTVTNGVVVGYVLVKATEIAGISSWWRILPHGIFELPAIFISFGLGIKLGFTLFLKREARTKEFKKRFYNSMNTILMIIIPLLIIAAIIEGVLIGFLE
ncbi:MAG: stage II sporulation protein M [Nanoarchaeota archaeon]|nr:stage II sporulation protein M [Nanoarchaeota archaeon]MBU0977812.1 stage II sporulation protein M [Nanoarchaeota archaeon]